MKIDTLNAPPVQSRRPGVYRVTVEDSTNGDAFRVEYTPENVQQMLLSLSIYDFDVLVRNLPELIKVQLRNRL